MEGINKTSQASMQELVSPCPYNAIISLTTRLQFDTYDFDKIHSHPGVRSDLFGRDLKQALITDFFGGVSRAEVTPPLFHVESPQSPPQFDDPHQEVPAEPVHPPDQTTPELLTPYELFVSQKQLSDRDARRSLRAWLAIGILVGLVGFVGSKRTR